MGRRNRSASKEKDPAPTKAPAQPQPEPAAAASGGGGGGGGGASGSAIVGGSRSGTLTVNKKARWAVLANGQLTLYKDKADLNTGKPPALLPMPLAHAAHDSPPFPSLPPCNGAQCLVRPRPRTTLLSWRL